MNCLTVSPYEPNSTRQNILDEVQDQAEHPTVKRLLRALADIEVVIPGIGLVDPRDQDSETQEDRWLSDMGSWAILTPAGINVEALAKEGAVAEMGLAYYDENGQGNRNWNFFIGAGYPDGAEFYRKMAADPDKRVIVVAGPHKLPGIRAALRGRLFNVLITETNSARDLLVEGKGAA
jgi:DNA-binding transcriptional regulator LsrR (DeoR family)